MHPNKREAPKGTDVTLKVAREGDPDPFELTITRDRIPIYSVPYHFMVRPGIGYARVTSFSRNTVKELSKALKI